MLSERQRRELHCLGGGGGGGPGVCSPGNSTFTPSMEGEGIACVAAVFMAACSIAARSLLALSHKKQSHTKKKNELHMRIPK